MNEDKGTGEYRTTLKTSNYVDENGKFKTGNDGRPKGATNKTTRDLRRFISNFLNEKAHEIPTLWDTLDNREKLSLFTHLSRLILPKTNEDEPTTPNQLKQPVWIIADNSLKNDIEPITGMEIIDSYEDENHSNKD